MRLSVDDPALDVARKVAEGFGPEVTPELVQAIQARIESVNEGDPLGCARADEAEGVIAVRINQGVYVWHFIKPATGDVWNDQSAVPEYPIVYQLPATTGKSEQEAEVDA